MGEEYQNNQDDQNLEIQEQEQEQGLKEQETGKTEKTEVSAVKILRNKLENLAKENKELKQRLSNFEELASVSDLENLVSKLNKLELENKIVKEYPEFSNEAEEIWKIRRSNESLEDTIARYIGLKELEAKKSQTTTRSNLGAMPSSEVDLTNLKSEEKEKFAREYFKQVYGTE